MGDTDSPEFNKSRGFLIGFSTLLGLLWFFGADLTKFKLLGNEIDLHQNEQHIWLVLAAVNAYLWLRFFQRLPRRGLRFDNRMHQLLDENLIKACRYTHYRKAYQLATEDLIASSSDQEDTKIIKLGMHGYMPFRDELEQRQGQGPHAPDGPWCFTYPNRAIVHYSLTKTTKQSISHGGQEYEAKPSRGLYKAAVVYTFIKGALTHSWFTDNVYPLLLGAISIGLATHSWVKINW